jgi:hypothetical protein
MKTLTILYCLDDKEKRLQIPSLTFITTCETLAEAKAIVATFERVVEWSFK